MDTPRSTKPRAQHAEHRLLAVAVAILVVWTIARELHQSVISIARVECNAQARIVRCQNGIGVRCRTRLAVAVNDHVVPRNLRIAAGRGFDEMGSGAGQVEPDFVAVLQFGKRLE